MGDLTPQERSEEIACHEVTLEHQEALRQRCLHAFETGESQVLFNPDDVFWLLLRVADPRIPTRDEPNADAGDCSTVCSLCGDETDEPHEPEWCADIIRRSGQADGDLEAQLDLAGAIGIAREPHGQDDLLDLVKDVVTRIQRELGHPRHMESSMRCWLRQVHFLAERGKRCQPPDDWAPKALPWLTAGSDAHECRSDDGVTCVTCQRDMTPGSQYAAEQANGG